MGAALGVLTLVVGAPARAQDDPSSEEAVQRLRLMVPEGRPDRYGTEEADAIYGELAGLVARTEAASDFGDGSRLTGPCGGFAYSYDADGFLLDAAADLGDAAPPVDLRDGRQAFTSVNPFKVDPSGIVLYYGFSPRDGTGPLDHHWTLATSGLGVDHGDDSNVDGENRNVGVIQLGDHLPLDFSARIKVDGDLNSQNLDACVGQGYVEFVGGGLISPIGFAALAVFAGGLAGLLFHARPTRTGKG